MTQEQIDIDKAFEDRWRIKGTNLCKDPYLFEQIKALCRDFFEAGILIAESSVCCRATTTIHGPALDGFETWWNMYGKKIDRGKCEKKWAKLSFVEKQACIASTPAYVASTPDLQFRRHPMTFLNNKSWENQIIQRNETNKTTLEEQRKHKLSAILTE